MVAKRSVTGVRLLRVLEAIAENQPIGIRALGRLLEDDKSAVHRAVAALSDEGWIQPSARVSQGWEVAPKIIAIIDRAFGGFDLMRRARPALERLRDLTGETAVLILVEHNTLVTADVVESPKMLRVIPKLRHAVPVAVSASGRAILPYLDEQKQFDLLRSKPDKHMLEQFSATRDRGYSVSYREADPDACSIGAPIFDPRGAVCGAAIIIGPSDRLPPEAQERFGPFVADSARTILRGTVA